MTVQIIPNNTNQWNPATLLSLSGKPTWKYSKAWNSQLQDGSVKSADFEGDVIMLEEISNPLAIERDREGTADEIPYLHIYLSDGKIATLENRKSQGVYTEVEDNNQPFPSTRWVISKKLVEGMPITRARLCPRGFEEIQDFQTDSPCCCRVGI